MMIVEAIDTAQQVAVSSEDIVAAARAASQWLAGAIAAMAGVFAMIIHWMMKRLDRKDDLNERAIATMEGNEESVQQAIALFKDAMTEAHKFESVMTQGHQAQMASLNELTAQMRLLRTAEHQAQRGA